MPALGNYHKAAIFWSAIEVGVRAEMAPLWALGDGTRLRPSAR